MCLIFKGLEIGNIEKVIESSRKMRRVDNDKEKIKNIGQPITNT